MKKIILLALTSLMMVRCGNNMALEDLDIVNGTKYVVTLKSNGMKRLKNTYGSINKKENVINIFGNYGNCKICM